MSNSSYISVRDRKKTPRSFDPDYMYWRSKEVWTLSEAAKLICGRDPVQKYPTPQKFNKKTKVIDIIDIAANAVSAGELNSVRSALIPIHIQVRAKEFMVWVFANDFEAPEPLRSLAEDTPEEFTDSESLIKERAITVARTLQAVDPTLTIVEIVLHPAMQLILADQRPRPEVLEGWLSDRRQNFESTKN